MALSVTSPAFQDGQPIPAEHTCSGADRFPPLKIAGVPAASRSLVLVVDDPDAPGGLWTHWTVWNLPPSTREVPTGFRPASVRAVEGTTSAGRAGWHGPCPPPGRPHRYFFRVCALDDELALAPGANRASLDAALKGHVLAEGALMGTFRR